MNHPFFAGPDIGRSVWDAVVHAATEIRGPENAVRLCSRRGTAERPIGLPLSADGHF
jgi:hypothetical protein